MDRRPFDRKWRFHDEMQYAIRPDQQGKILIVFTVAGLGAGGAGNVEDSLRVFEQGVHAKYLSAGLPAF
jgi:hypothetical protein